MLTKEMNDRLTQVGPGTPMGELMRRYWQPIAGSAELGDASPTKEIRLLGEDLVLFRDTSGRLGCIEPRCAHRKAHLGYGIPEANGLRCAYHGWVYDVNGQCVEQPSEPVGSRFKDKIKLKSYQVQELGGVVFVYMGPKPAPLLPRYDVLVWDGIRDVWATMLPCNWLQCQENSLDPLHFQWLHRYYGGWFLNRTQPKEIRDTWNRQIGARGADHHKLGFEITDYGVIKRRLVGDETEEDDHWRIGHPVLFPHILRVTHGLEIRVPVDDTHTYHLNLNYRIREPNEPEQTEVPFEERPLYDENGQIIRNYVIAQDQFSWVIQGDLMDRSDEHLGVTDVGIIMYRKMLDEQIDVVLDGGDPMNTYRDPAKNECLVFPCEYYRYPGYEGLGGPFKDYKPRKPDVEAILSGEGAKLPEWTEIDPNVDRSISGLRERWISDGKRGALPTS